MLWYVLAFVNVTQSIAIWLASNLGDLVKHFVLGLTS